MRSAPVWAAYRRPRSVKIRQSAASWFQRASRTSVSTSSSSDAVKDGLMANRSSEVAIARIVMSVLAEARQTAADPVRGPIDEGQQRYARITEQSRRLGGVDPPAPRGLDARGNRGGAPAPAERLWPPPPRPRLPGP